MALEGPTETFLELIDGLKAQNEESNRKLYERYIKSIIRLASKYLAPHLRALVDPESVAHSAIMEIINGVRSDAVQFQGWASLFCFLATVTKRKALNENRYHNQAKRNGKKVGGNGDPLPDISFFEHLAVNPEADPGEIVEIQDLIEVTLGRLEEQSKITIKLFLKNTSKMETAKELGISIRTVERRIEDFQAEYDRVASSGTFS